MAKREPVAEIGVDDYRIVRHTHDIELAKRLMLAEVRREYRAECGEDPDYELEDVGTPRQRWMRIVPCLPGTIGHTDGWRFEYQDADGPGRGVFPAVVFS